jgi:hypothetical protein
LLPRRFPSGRTRVEREERDSLLAGEVKELAIIRDVAPALLPHALEVSLAHLAAHERVGVGLEGPLEHLQPKRHLVGEACRHRLQHGQLDRVVVGVVVRLANVHHRKPAQIVERLGLGE